MSRVAVLIPSCKRPAALAVTLTSLVGQSFADFKVVVSDQSDEPVAAAASIQAAPGS